MVKLTIGESSGAEYGPVAEEVVTLTATDESLIELVVPETITFAIVEAFVQEYQIPEFDSLTGTEEASSLLTQYNACVPRTAFFVPVETAQLDVVDPHDVEWEAYEDILYVDVDELIVLSSGDEVSSCYLPIDLTEDGTLIAVETVPSLDLIDIDTEILAPLVSSGLLADVSDTDEGLTYPLKVLDVGTASVPVELSELLIPLVSESAHAEFLGWASVAHSETLGLILSETHLEAVTITRAEDGTLHWGEQSDADIRFPPHSPVPSVEYTFELRKRINKYQYDLLGIFTHVIEPSWTTEVGAADELTFRIPITHPYAWQLLGPTAGKEIWYYGRDAKLVQIFVLQTINPSRSTQGSYLTVTADGLEAYMTMYQVKDQYRVAQRLAQDVLADIAKQMLTDGMIHRVYVDPLLNKPLDVDLSWENVYTAIEGLTKQTGGYAVMRADPANGIWREIQILPLTDINLNSPYAVGTAMSMQAPTEPNISNPDRSPNVALTAWPSDGVAVNNMATSNTMLSSTYNAVARKNQQFVLPSGATGWTSDADDVIRIPIGIDIATPYEFTLEFIVYVGTQTVAESAIMSKTGFKVTYDATNHRILLKRGTDTVTDIWATPVNSVLEGDWYMIQISYDCGYEVDPEAEPTVYIDNVSQVMTYVQEGSGYWTDDYEAPLYLLNDSTLAMSFIGAITLFRFYKIARTEDECYANFLADAWRRAPLEAPIILDMFPVTESFPPEALTL